MQFALTVLGSEMLSSDSLPQGLQAVASAVGASGPAVADLAAWPVPRGAVSAGPGSKTLLGAGPVFPDQDLLARLTQVLGAGTVGEQIRQLELHMDNLQQLEQEAKGEDSQ